MWFLTRSEKSECLWKETGAGEDVCVQLQKGQVTVQDVEVLEKLEVAENSEREIRNRLVAV